MVGPDGRLVVKSTLENTCDASRVAQDIVYFCRHVIRLFIFVQSSSCRGGTKTQEFIWEKISGGMHIEVGMTSISTNPIALL